MFQMLDIECTPIEWSVLLEEIHYHEWIASLYRQSLLPLMRLCGGDVPPAWWVELMVDAEDNVRILQTQLDCLLEGGK